MTWLTKNLTLDLLSIAIDGMNKTFNRINDDEDQNPLSPVTKATQTPQPVQQQQAPETETQPNPEELHTQAQTLLRTIAQKEGNDWILSTLFPQFGVQSLTEVPAEKLPRLINLAQQHTQDAV